MKIVSIMFSMLFLLSGDIIADEQQQEVSTESTQTQSANVAVKKFTTLGFKGIHLGMTVAEVKEVVSSGSGWSFMFNEPTDNDEFIYLNTESSIGCIGEGETEKCYHISSVTIKFFEGRAIKIKIESPEYSADGIDPHVKDWARFGLQVLRKKYGPPSKAYHSIDKLNIFSFQSGYSVFLDEWNKKDEAVRLAIGTSEFQYYAQIIYINRKAEAKIERERKKIKSEM